MSAGRVSIRMMLLGSCVKFEGRCCLEPREQRSPWREGPTRPSVFKGREEELARSWGGSLAEPAVNHHGKQCFEVRDVVRIFKLSWEVE